MVPLLLLPLACAPKPEEPEQAPPSRFVDSTSQAAVCYPTLQRALGEDNNQLNYSYLQTEIPQGTSLVQPSFQNIRAGTMFFGNAKDGANERAWLTSPSSDPVSFDYDGQSIDLSQTSVLFNEFQFCKGVDGVVTFSGWSDGQVAGISSLYVSVQITSTDTLCENALVYPYQEAPADPLPGSLPLPTQQATSEDPRTPVTATGYFYKVDNTVRGLEAVSTLVSETDVDRVGNVFSVCRFQ